MRRHRQGPISETHSARAVILDAVGVLSLFVLLFAVLHLPIMA